MNVQTPNSKLNVDEPLKAIKVIDFLFFLVLIIINSSWLLVYLTAIALKAAAENDADLKPYLHNSL